VTAAAEAHSGKRIEVWFEDEARVGQKGRVCHRWWRTGQRPPGICDRRYDWAYLFAAVRPATGDDFALVLPEVSTEAMQTFLDGFAAHLAPDVHAVLVLDQAGWHGATALRVPETISLVPLPPYSPELNPVERNLALPARTLPVPADLPRLQRHRRGLLPSLEQPGRRRRPDRLPMQLPLDQKGRFIDSPV
jgi:putative transposase